ncbi:TlpA family protein disulfide reductase [Luteolibacter pohnpeiensis]|uniref:TlpA family protein disulfide reductase n=1 Tax=Luteolibacter pohnpeiensis TaxID=454153 RepID=A0A934SBT2_9BACT|nr:TlpA disulfide reductase family protein [Luteolibacter pohnpeiensis]MBK1883272.1 TlpA family protein disulfide reductase [Luteolibacter pohnpeiensis]
MRALSLTALLFLSSIHLSTAQSAPATPDAEISESPMDRIFSERGPQEKFDAAIAEAKKSGVGDQPILEARFLYYVDRHDDDAIAKLLPEFEAHTKEFDLDQSEIFATKEDWLAVCEYVRAIKALKEDDKDGFKKHITEAFWLSPRQGAAFAPHIDRLRLDEAMAAVKVDFSIKLNSLLKDGPVTLSDLIKDHQALLLHFWSPWSRECEETMPDFVTTANEVLSKKIAVASILPEDSAEVLTDAKELIASLGDKPPGKWLIDQKQGSLNRLLRIQSVPTVVLISSEGKVLYNGHPADSGFWKALLKVNPELKRPASQDVTDEP